MFTVLKSTVVHANGKLPYQQAKQAFAAGRYSEAAALFFDAERRGYREANLHYNLGVTHFKLGEYAAAAQRFRRLLADTRWSDLALLNLGIVAQSQGEPALAAIYYREGARNAGSETLRATFAQQLVALGFAPEVSETELSTPEAPPVAATEEQEPSPAAPRFDAYLSLAYGADDNPALVRDDLEIDGVEPGSDRFTEAHAFASMALLRRDAHQLSMSASAYSRNFASSDNFDVTGSALSLRYDWQGEHWSWKPALKLEHYEVDTEVYTSAASLSLGVQYQGSLRWRANLAGAHIEAGERYQFLDGGRYQAMTSLGQRLGGEGRHSGGWELGYRYELNDRRDSRDARRVLDFSPARGTAFIDADWRFSPYWSTELKLHYRESRYDSRNRLTTGTDGEVVFDKRIDERFAAHWGLRLTFSEAIQSVLTISHQDSDSSLSVFDYRGNQASLALQLAY